MPWDFDPARDLAGSPEHAGDAESLWARLGPHLSGFGISRVADITGLDRLGVPVVQVCRPLARSNAVTQGKGVSLAAAAVGAVLECVEMAAGEDLPAEACWQGGLSAAEMAPWRFLAPPDVAWPTRQEAWRRGWDVTAGKWVPVPQAVVCTDFTRGAASEAAPILRTSVGLGAGAGWAAAVWHGLLEVIECDARLRFFDRPGGDGPAQLRPAGAVPPALLARIAGQGLRIGAWEMTARPGPRTVMVRIMEDPAGNPALPLPAEGFACRPMLAEAVEAALLEAAQGRLAAISGAREDMTRALYRLRPPEAVRTRDWARLDPGRGREAAKDGSCPANPVQLAAALPGPVVVVPLLARPEIPLAVVRVLAPGLVTDPERLRDRAV